MNPPFRYNGRKLKDCPCCKGEAAAECLIIEAVVFCTKCGLKIVRRHASKLKDNGLWEAIDAWEYRA